MRIYSLRTQVCPCSSSPALHQESLPAHRRQKLQSRRSIHTPNLHCNLVNSSARKRRRSSTKTCAAPEGGISGEAETAEEADADPEAAVLLVACGVGLLTGAGVVLFNDAIHLIRHYAWSSMPVQGSAEWGVEFGQWARHLSLSKSVSALVLPPTLGGLAVGLLRVAVGGFSDPPKPDKAAVSSAPQPAPNRLTPSNLDAAVPASATGAASWNSSSGPVAATGVETPVLGRQPAAVAAGTLSNGVTVQASAAALQPLPGPTVAAEVLGSTLALAPTAASLLQSAFGPQDQQTDSPAGSAADLADAAAGDRRAANGTASSSGRSDESAALSREHRRAEVRSATAGIPPPAVGSSGSIVSPNSAVDPGLWSLAGLHSALRPVYKAAAAAVTLGSGASLGPEGPSVDIGRAAALRLGGVLRSRRQHMVPLLAAGSGAGVAAGFGAPISGVFFAVETVLQLQRGGSARDPSLAGGAKADEDPSGLTVAGVLLASVLAAVVSQAGLGSEPAFSVPDYELHSVAEMPLVLALGALCGVVSASFLHADKVSSNAWSRLRSPRYERLQHVLFPAAAGLATGIAALAYPEVLYQGFGNVNAILQQQGEYAPQLLLQVVAVKIATTALCRHSGLVGGIYAPSIFMGAALGSAFGDLAGAAGDHIGVAVTAPQAYALVGVAAMLASNCRVPLTAVLLLFELTRDYFIIVPTLGAVGISYWVAYLPALRTASDAPDGTSPGPASAADGSAAGGGGFGSLPRAPMCDTEDATVACLLEEGLPRVRASDPIRVAADALERSAASVALVTDGSGDAVVGLVTRESVEGWAQSWRREEPAASAK